MSGTAVAASFVIGYAWPRPRPVEPLALDSAVANEVAPEPAAPSEPPPDHATLVAHWHGAPAAGRESQLFRALARWLDASGTPAFDEIANFRREALPDALSRWLGERGLPFVLVQIGNRDLGAAVEILGRHQWVELSRAPAPLLLGAPANTLQTLVADGRFDGEPTEWFRAGERLAELGPEAAAVILTKLESARINKHIRDNDENLRVAVGYASGLAARSSDGALTFAGSLPEPLVAHAQRAALAAMVPPDPDRAKAEAIRLGFVDAVAEKMAATDLPAALDWLEEATAGTEPQLRHDAMRTLAPALRGLPVADAVATLDRFLWDVGPVHPHPPRTDALGAFALAYLVPFGLADAPALVDSLAPLPPSPGRDVLLGTALKLWALRQPEAAAQRALDLVDAGNSTFLAQGLVSHLAMAPASAIAIANRLDDAERQQFVHGFRHVAHAENPAAAAAALAAHADAPSAPTLTRALAEMWASDDFFSVAAWLSTFPKGESRDAGIAAFVRQIAPLAPRSANRWVAMMTEPARRADAIEFAYRNWPSAYRDSAQAWLESTSLDRDRMAALLAP
ncbi:hypothetical protein BH23VER1_BH23VER1_12870 [soil metagenome]